MDIIPPDKVEPGAVYKPGEAKSDREDLDVAARIAASAGDRALEVDHQQAVQRADSPWGDLGGGMVPKPEEKPPAPKGRVPKPGGYNPKGNGPDEIVYNPGSDPQMQGLTGEAAAAQAPVNQKGAKMGKDAIAAVETAEERAHRLAITRTPIQRREVDEEEVARESLEKLDQLKTVGAVRREQGRGLPADAVNGAVNHSEDQ